MKILLISIGTRGDMEPFLALAEILDKSGHEVCCVFPEQFRPLAESSNIKFESLGSDYINFLMGDAGKLVMSGGGSFMERIKAYATLIKHQTPINKDLIKRQKDIVDEFQPDKILHSGKAIYPVIWGLKHPGKVIFISPVPYMHYVKDHTHIGFNGNWGPWLNKMSYKLADFGLIKTIMTAVNWLNEGKSIKQKEVQKALFSNDCIYTLSPSLFERPDYWPENIKVLGYHERNKTLDWEPGAELNAFIDRQDKLLLLSFGSMAGSDPLGRTEIILKVLRKLGIPALVNTAGGGLVELKHYNKELFHFVDRIPYDWAFPKMHAVMHHGGSGTTHTGLKYGCATLIIPHIIDQFVWNSIVHQKGAGPLGPKASKLNEANLEAALSDLWNNGEYKRRAEALGAKMRSEHYENEIESFITT